MSKQVTTLARPPESGMHVPPGSHWGCTETFVAVVVVVVVVVVEASQTRPRKLPSLDLRDRRCKDSPQRLVVVVVVVIVVAVATTF